MEIREKGDFRCWGIPMLRLKNRCWGISPQPPDWNLISRLDCLRFSCSCGQFNLSLATVWVTTSSNSFVIRWGALRGGALSFHITGDKRTLASHPVRNACSMISMRMQRPAPPERRQAWSGELRWTMTRSDHTQLSSRSSPRHSN